MAYYVVVNTGCLECGVDSNVVLLTADKALAERVCETCRLNYDWRQGGQNAFDVFEVKMDNIPDEYEVFHDPASPEYFIPPEYPTPLVADESEE